MKKKSAYLIICMALTASLLAGCGNGRTESTSSEKIYESPAEYTETSDGNSSKKDSKPSDKTGSKSTKADQYTEAVAETADESARSAQKVESSGTTYDFAADLSSNSASTEVEEGWYYDYYDGYYNTEEYSGIVENGFCDALTSPLSTFAADVDTASYSNFRRFVNQGYGLYDFPVGALRTEEMVNYFKYDYPEPKKGETFGVNATISDCPWNEDAKLMVLGINTKKIKAEKMPDSNIVFLVDVSGSMSDWNKLPLIQESMDLLIDSFDEDDRISIVTYASGTEVVLDGVSGDEHKKISRAFNRLKAQGSTNGGEGIKLAYKLAEENFIEDGVNRVIICSDGDFNVGLTSREELEELISDKKESGIFLSVLGFGMYNYSDTNMETLADKGNGNYAYIDTLQEAEKVLVEEMTQTFMTVAKDVKFQVEFNPAMVSEYRLVGYENRGMAAEDFKDDTKDGGEMGAGHQVSAIYEIVLSDGKTKGSDLKYSDSSISKKGSKKDEYCTVSIAYKEPEGEKSVYTEYPIGSENYTKRPDDDFLFAAMVAETSLALRNSEYLSDVTPDEAINNIIDELYEMEDMDEYREEFLELVEYLVDGSYYYYE